MADDPRANEPVVEQAPAEPTGEQNQPAEQVEAAPVQETAQTPQAEPPESSSDHAKEQWARLQESLRTEREALRAEREKRIYYEGVFSQIKNQSNPFLNKPEAPKEEEIKLPPVYDPTTGLINEKAFDVYAKQLADAKKAAAEAREIARQAQLQNEESRKQSILREQRKEEEETFKAYPQLNPKIPEKMDKELHAETRAKLLDSMMHPEDYGGKQLTFKEAADLAYKRLGRTVQKQVEQAKEEGKKEVINNLQPKEQASLEAGGANSNVRAPEIDLEDEERLRFRSRRTGPDADEALVLRMRKIYGAHKAQG